MYALRLVAPGTQLREGLDRILQARMGALIVIGDGPDVLSVCSGGFLLDSEFTPQRLSELAKMDGAIILASDASRVARANVHLVPDPNIPTSETGTRHRTAERVGRQLDVPVITVSEDMSVVTIHRRGEKHTLEPIPRVLARADQALQILGRYKSRLDAVSGSLSALEVEDLVTVRDVATVLQRAEMVRRIAEEIEGYVVELGADGRLVMLQLEELIGGVEDDRRLVAKDYFQPSADFELVDVMRTRSPPSTTSSPRPRTRSRRCSTSGPSVGIDSALQPRGFRLLHKIPRLPETGVRPRGRPLREPAEDHAGRARRSHRGRRRRRGARPCDQGRSVAPRGDVDPRAVRLSTRTRASEEQLPELETGPDEVDVEHITLKGVDGTLVDAIHARPDGMPERGLVLHPDIMGLRPLFDDLCRRLATHGFAVCATEPFARAPVDVRVGAGSDARAWVT